MININRLMAMAPTDGNLKAVWFNGFLIGLLGLRKETNNPYKDESEVGLAGDVETLAPFDLWNAGHEVGIRERMRAYATIDADFEVSDTKEQTMETGA